MIVSLSWQGPLGVGAIPRDPLLFENLCQPGVYLRVKTYDYGRLVVYVGQSSSLLARFDQHLSSMLALASPLRDPSGEVVFSADAGVRLQAFKDLDRYSSLACDDVRRVLFFYAKCDNYFHNEHLNLVEALLQDRIRGRLNEIENAHDRILVFHEGRILMDGHLDKLLKSTMDYHQFQIEFDTLDDKLYQQLKNIPTVVSPNRLDNIFHFYGRTRTVFFDVIKIASNHMMIDLNVKKLGLRDLLDSEFAGRGLD